jgi:hypothetical protein
MSWHPTLDSIESRTEPYQPGWQKRRAAPPLPVIYGPGCWCGERFSHPWPGKDSGAPHPRDWPGRVNGHPFRPAAGGGA